MGKNLNKKLLFAILSFCMFAFGLQIGGLQMVLLSVATEYKLSNALMGSLVTIQYIAVMIAPILFGRTSDRKGRKNVLIIFSGIFVLGCMSVVLIPNLAGFLCGMFLIGGGASVGWGTVSSALADTYQEKASMFINLSFCCYSLGALVSPHINNFCINNLGLSWRICFIIAAVAVAVGAILVMFTAFSPQPVNVQPSGAGPAKKEFGFLGSIVFIALFLSMLTYCFIENGIGFFANVYFTDIMGTPALTATAISIYWFMMIPARLLLGVLNRFRRPLLAFSFIGMIALLLGLFLTKSPTFAIVLIGGIGFIGGPVFSTLIGLSAEAFPQNAGIATGAVIAGSGLGGAVSPFIMGLIADTTDARAAYFVLALICVVGALSFLTYLFKTRSSTSAA